MKKIYADLFVMCSVSASYGGSYTCTTVNVSSVPSGYSSIANGNGLADTCSSIETQYFCSSTNKLCEAITVCNSCSSGYTLKTKTITDISLLQVCNASITIPYCCKNCSSCTSDTSWTIDVFKGVGYPGYDRMYERACNCDGTCAATAKYRCSDGYCGEASYNAASGPSGCYARPENGYCISGGGYGCDAGYYSGGRVCTRCPVVPNVYHDDSLAQPVYGTTVTSNNAVINACFLAAGEYYDELGNRFQILDTGTCYY